MNAISSLLWFVAIVALIPATLWLLKRTPIGGAGAAGPIKGVLRNVATLPLSASQRIVAVEVGAGEDRRWLVLGVTPSSIATLHTMAPVALAANDPHAAPPPAHPAFAQILGRLHRRPADEAR